MCLLIPRETRDSGTAGAGDTLTGLISGFLAQAYGTLKGKADPVVATVAALYVGGLAGDFAAKKLECERWSLQTFANTSVMRYAFSTRVENSHNSHIPTGQFTSSSPEETFNYGHQVGARLEGGEILLLSGPLGAGKTIFVKGICAALGIAEEEVTSPSFTLVNPTCGTPAALPPRPLSLG